MNAAKNIANQNQSPRRMMIPAKEASLKRFLRDNLYLGFLSIEIGVVLYDAVFAGSAANKWSRLAVLVIGFVAFYAWSRRTWLTWKWVWRALFVIVIGWFFVYVPWDTLREWKALEETTKELGFGVLIPGYLIYYLLHVPMFFALYSAAFRSHVVIGESRSPTV